MWTNSIRQTHPVICNDFSFAIDDNVHQKQHLAITRHMSVPIHDGNKIVALVGVANKNTPYTDFDIKQLSLLFEAMWKIVHRKELENALKVFSDDFDKANNDLKSINCIKKEFVEDKDDQLVLMCEGSFIEKETLRSLTRQQNAAIDTVIKSSLKLKGVVDSLLYLDMEHSKTSSKGMDEVNLRSILDNAILNVILSANEKNIILTKSIHVESPFIIADKNGLTNAITRIIESLIPFVPQEGNIAVIVTEKDTSINLEIKDNGSGIPEAIISNLFVRFYQVSENDPKILSKVYEELKSTFYLCKNIIDLHDGDIHVESKEGEGTTVFIRLPKINTISGKNKVEEVCYDV